MKGLERKRKKGGEGGEGDGGKEKGDEERVSLNVRKYQQFAPTTHLPVGSLSKLQRHGHLTPLNLRLSLLKLQICCNGETVTPHQIPHSPSPSLVL